MRCRTPVPDDDARAVTQPWLVARSGNGSVPRRSPRPRQTKKDGPGGYAVQFAVQGTGNCKARPASSNAKAKCGFRPAKIYLQKSLNRVGLNSVYLTVC